MDEAVNYTIVTVNYTIVDGKYHHNWKNKGTLQPAPRKGCAVFLCALKKGFKKGFKITLKKRDEKIMAKKNKNP